MPTMQPTGVESRVGDLARFYQALEDAGAQERATVLAAVEDRLQGFLFGAGGRRRCPSCEDGTLELKLSRYGPFVGCGAFPACGYRGPNGWYV